MKCPLIDYQILGDDLQMVEIELDPGETVIAEAGMMTCIEDGIEFETKMGDGSQPDQAAGQAAIGRQARSPASRSS